MIHPQRNLYCAPQSAPKPPGSHPFPELKTTQPAAHSDVTALLLLEGQ